MNDYFYALVDRINGYGYEDMLSVLYNTPFTSRIPKDNNRLKDCIALRDRYGYFNRQDGNCFEIFVCLALDMDELLRDQDHGDRTEEWFWLMMTNIGLVNYDNNNFNEKEVENIIDIFVKRKYKTDGRGGPFPLRYPRDNMRKTDLWYQLNWYVNENFEYEFNDLEEFEDE